MFCAKRRFDGDLGCEWAKDNTLDNKLKELPENCDFYVVKHWFLKSSCAPSIEVFVERNDVESYLKDFVLAGDYLEIWGIDKEKMTYIDAKMPDRDGLIPVKGCAY
jgi:hypothetical protein